MIRKKNIKIYKKKKNNKIHRINEEIKNHKIKLINNKDKKINIIETKKALKIAKSINLDLVEINSKINPPICKFLNYGKYLYIKQKNKKKKNKNKNTQIKEIKFRINTSLNDYKIKINNIIKFIKNNYKVKITILLKGREIIHKNIAISMINKIKYELEIINKLKFVSNNIKNRQIIMMITPKKK